jgi:hypothetical protein
MTGPSAATATDVAAVAFVAGWLTSSLVAAMRRADQRRQAHRHAAYLERKAREQRRACHGWTAADILVAANEFHADLRLDQQ